ncbi:uncharacterized protein TM35_000341860 [Trypanosoma theileri]|uniref:Cyclin N-terminal domain-containing protein n=1 Tax=Trypanosoma theileri TaxID=67003 RepID=A0A1X0NLE1_9TRYP|nr:uncharacterized protein TM35_000341860 [Trypanosoma theileri]ORC85574.1 hypothetical protein TM35_000341860 [Trypanosoma theileri]
MDAVLPTETDKIAIDRLLTCGLPRTLARHAIIVLHCFRTFSKEDVPIDVLVGGCVLYSLKQRQCPSATKVIKKCLERVKESDIVGFELLLVQIVRENILLVEACLRCVFQEILLINPSLGFNRERTIQICLHLICNLYETRWCLFPESAARGALIVACEKCKAGPLKLSKSFEEPMVTRIADYLRKTFV